MREQNLTFENLPEAVALLIQKVDGLKTLIENQPGSQADEFLTIEEAAVFLSLSLPTIYSKVSKKELPHMKRGKRLYFSKKELEIYLMDGRRKTSSEIETEADKFLTKKGGKA